MYEDLDGINIINDARHGWRNNSKYTSVVVIGEKTHKVLHCVNITKVDDEVELRQEQSDLHKYSTRQQLSRKGT